jgi:hypothetical protein
VTRRPSRADARAASGTRQFPGTFMLTGPSARNGVIAKSPLGTASANPIHPNLVMLLPQPILRIRPNPSETVVAHNQIASRYSTASIFISLIYLLSLIYDEMHTDAPQPVRIA